MRLQRTGLCLTEIFLAHTVMGACLAMTFLATAQAQTRALGSQPAPVSGQPDADRPGSQPFSEHASNTGTDAGAPQIAPSLPLPPVDENASPEELLHAARSAIARGRTGEAQEAMERAQTRLLDRSVPLFKTNQPSAHPAIPLISQALRALGAGDRAAAMGYLDKALPLAIPPKE